MLIWYAVVEAQLHWIRHIASTRFNGLTAITDPHTTHKMDPNGDSDVGLIKIAANEGQQSAKYNETCRAVL